MAYEAAREALGAGAPRGRRDRVTLSAALRAAQALGSPWRRALGLAEARAATTWAATPASLLDGLELAGALVAADGARPGAGGGHRPPGSYEERVCDMLSAGGAAAFLVGAAGGFCRLGPSGPRRPRGL